MLSRMRLCRSSLLNHQTIRSYSFESGRKPKRTGSVIDADPDQVSPPSNDQLDSKPIVISGRGRRLSPRNIKSNSSSSSSSSSSHSISIPKLTLPFKPLSSNHLSHLRPTTLLLDLFFSSQRPLLEIEIAPSDRRSITSELKQSRLDQDLELSSTREDQQDQLLYSQITSGSPSDPAFKPPLPSSARPPSDDNELGDQLWPTTDPYSAYLITEPDGVHPAWTDALKRSLATSQAFVPPPLPEAKHDLTPVKQALESEACSGKQKNKASFQPETGTTFDLEQQRAIQFLNPFSPSSSKTSNIDDQSTQEVQSSPENPLNDIPQDSLSLTMQAARFLHFGMMATRWPTAASWTAIESKLASAENSFNGLENPSLTDVENFKDSFPAVRGENRPASSERRSRNNSSKQWISIRAEGREGQTFSFNTDQLSEIIKYSQKIIQGKMGVESMPQSVLKNLERFGEFLIHKHLKGSNPLLQPGSKLHQARSIKIPSIPIVIVDQSTPPNGLDKSTDGTVIHLDSVFRKKKRKMKVHKYKKRRKARNTLKKRQGRN